MLTDGRIGDRVTELRKRLGLTRPALAQRSGLQKTTLFNVEHGLSRPAPATVTALAKALDCTEEYLRYGFAVERACRDRPETLDELEAFGRQQSADLWEHIRRVIHAEIRRRMAQLLDDVERRYPELRDALQVIRVHALLLGMVAEDTDQSRPDDGQQPPGERQEPPA